MLNFDTKIYIFRYIAVLKKVRYALCPMPYALCPMPYAQSYLIFLRKAITFPCPKLLNPNSGYIKVNAKQ